MNKIKSRVRRSQKTKAIIRLSNRPRLVVYRSASNIYAQITVPGNLGDQVLVSASTVEKDIKRTLTGNKTEQANQVGVLIAERAKNKGIDEVAFDRAGYKYHGRVKALAEGARKAGLII